MNDSVSHFGRTLADAVHEGSDNTSHCGTTLSDLVHREEVQAEVIALPDKAVQEPRRLAEKAVLDAAVRWYQGLPGATALLATATRHWYDLSVIPEPVSPPPRARRVRVRYAPVLLGSRRVHRWGWKCECGLGGAFFIEPDAAADRGRTHLAETHGKASSS